MIDCAWAESHSWFGTGMFVAAIVLLLATLFWNLRLQRDIRQWREEIDAVERGARREMARRMAAGNDNAEGRRC